MGNLDNPIASDAANCGPEEDQNILVIPEDDVQALKEMEENICSMTKDQLTGFLDTLSDENQLKFLLVNIQNLNQETQEHIVSQLDTLYSTSSNVFTDNLDALAQLSESDLTILMGKFRGPSQPILEAIAASGYSLERREVMKAILRGSRQWNAILFIVNNLPNDSDDVISDIMSTISLSNLFSDEFVRILSVSNDVRFDRVLDIARTNGGAATILDRMDATDNFGDFIVSIPKESQGRILMTCAETLGAGKTYQSLSNRSVNILGPLLMGQLFQSMTVEDIALLGKGWNTHIEDYQLQILLEKGSSFKDILTEWGYIDAEDKGYVYEREVGELDPEKGEDVEVALAFVRRHSVNYIDLSHEMKAQDRVVALMQDHAPHVLLQHGPESVIGNKDLILSMITQEGGLLELVKNEFKRDREVVMAAVTNYGYSLRFASRELRRDREIVLAALETSGYPLEYALGDVRYDVVVLQKALSHNQLPSSVAEDFLKNAPLEARSNKDLVLAIVTQSYHDFEHVIPELRGDKDIAIAAVSRYGLLIQYVEGDAKYDRDVVFAALTGETPSLPHDFLEEFFENTLEENLSDPELMQAILIKEPELYQRVNDVISGNRDIALAVFEASYFNFEHLPTEFRGDKDIAISAVSKFGLLFKDVTGDARYDGDVLLTALNEGNVSSTDLEDFLTHASKEIVETNFELISAMVSRDVFIYSKLPDIWRYSSQIALIAVSGYGGNLFYVSERLQDDEEIVRAAIADEPDAIKYASERLQEKLGASVD